MNKKLPISATKSPIKIQVEENKNYFWCSCGLSENQPFCDGKHKGTGFKPIAYQSSESKQVAFCGCKKSKKQMLCDGSHRLLT